VCSKYTQKHAFKENISIATVYKINTNTAVLMKNNLNKYNGRSN
jgi:hypothetical protein